MLIQVVGLPCSGKSTTIKNLQKKSDFLFLDKKNLKEDPTQSDLTKLLQSSEKKICIIESACGYESIESIVVLLSIPSSLREKNEKKRLYKTTPKDVDQIKYQTIPANYIVYSTKELRKILTILLKR